MATLDDSPSLFSGQDWSQWEGHILSNTGNDQNDNEEDEKDKSSSDTSMKLRREDLPLFGVCPSQDELYLVVCEKCNHVIKPQAFQKHLDLRHGGRGHSTKLSSKSPTKAAMHSPFLSSHLSVSSKSSTRLTSHTSHPPFRTGHSVPTKASVKEPPPAFKNAAAHKVGAVNITAAAATSTTESEVKDTVITSPSKVGSGIGAKLKDSKLKKNHTMPVVKLDRMPDTLAMKKQLPSSHVQDTFTKTTISNSLTNGTVKSSSNTPIKAASSPKQTIDIKPLLLESSCSVSTVASSPTPVMTMTFTSLASSVSGISIGSGSPNHQMVSISLTPSPVSSATTSVAMATSTGTLTTTTVTTTITSIPSVVTSTMMSPTPSVSSSSISNSGSAGSATSSLQRFNIEKPEKLLPLKDREYDPNKHCGVIVAETGQHCTRSLTCKSHALSLRRAVQGRRLPFDELLKEHKEAKEAYQKFKAQSKEAALAAKNAAQAAGSKSHGASPMASPISKPHLHPNLSSVKDSRLIHPPSTPPQKISHSQPKLVSPGAQLVNRPNFASLHTPSPALREEPRRESVDTQNESQTEDGDERDDSPNLYYPRPAAVCSFGARYHSYGSLHCHTFGRKNDFLRAAFLDLLERHLHPPPPKKLCVESNLPKEAQSVSNSKDPYEFDLVDMNTGAAAAAAAVHNNVNSVLTPPKKTEIVKPKTKPSPTTGGGGVVRTKSREGSAGARSPGSTGTPSNIGGPSSAKKRRSSGSGTGGGSGGTGGGTPGSTTVSPAGGIVKSSNLSSANIMNSIGAVSSTSGTSPFAIAIPNVNLSGTTLSHINATLAQPGKQNKNNLIKDMGFVVGIPQEAIINGQYVNITGTHVGDLGGTTQITLDEKSLQQAHVIGNNKNITTAKFINNFDTLRAIPKNNLIAAVPHNAIMLEGVQPGTVLAPVSITAAHGNPVVSLASTAVSPPQQSPSPSTYIRSGSSSPQVSTSPLPNGVVPSPSD